MRVVLSGRSAPQIPSWGAEISGHTRSLRWEALARLRPVWRLLGKRRALRRYSNSASFFEKFLTTHRQPDIGTHQRHKSGSEETASSALGGPVFYGFMILSGRPRFRAISGYLKTHGGQILSRGRNFCQSNNEMVTHRQKIIWPLRT